jgi:PAS domain S-box-containing protein
LAEVIASYVRSLGYELSGIVDSGEAALAVVALERPALALLDIQIRGSMNGFGVAEALRREHDIPSVFLTSLCDDQTLEAVRASSSYGYLSKPFRLEELRAAIQLALIRYAQETRWKQVEQSFAAAIHSTSDGVIITDTRENVQFMNPAAERLTGWLSRLAQGQKLADVFQTPKGDTSLARLWQTAFAGDAVREEIRVGRKGGVERVDASLARVQDAARGPQGVVLVLRDNTAHYQVQAELRQAQAQIRCLTDQVGADKSKT